MEAKVKEEVPDKDYLQTSTEKRKLSITCKERKSPDEEESRTSPTTTPTSPQNNGTGTDSSSPPLADGSRISPLHRLKRFLSALQQFANDISTETGERVKQLIFNVVGGSITVEEFQISIQECTNYPLRASVPAFLRALLPHAQRDVVSRARAVKQTPLQYIRSHEQLILETSPGEAVEIFNTPSSTEGPLKRRASDPFYETLAQTNGTHVDPMDCPPQPKRVASSLFLNPTPFLYPLPGTSAMFEYPHGYHPGFHGPGDSGCERRDAGGISVRDVQSMNASFADVRTNLSSAHNHGSFKTDDEWKNINTMLNCILSMVEKTKRALAILQQRGVEPTENNDIKRAASEIMASAVRQTEERVADVRRRAEDAVNQVKRQALLDLQRAVGAAESKALELVAAERSKMERLFAERLQERRSSPPPGSRDVSPTPGPNNQQNCCWNCGRKAQETCSGCNAARYCGSFCQHKDWENHHQVCSGRDQKPTMVTTSPPVTQTNTLTKSLARSTTPITTPSTPTERLSLTTLNNAERMLSTTVERNINQSNERIALANLSSAQGLITAIGGKK